MSLGKLLMCQWMIPSGISSPNLTISWAATDAPIHNNTHPQLFFGLYVRGVTQSDDGITTFSSRNRVWPLSSTWRTPGSTAQAPRLTGFTNLLYPNVIITGRFFIQHFLEYTIYPCNTEYQYANIHNFYTIYTQFYLVVKF